MKPTVGLRISNPNFCTAIHLDTAQANRSTDSPIRYRRPVAREGSSQRTVARRVLGEHAIGILPHA